MKVYRSDHEDRTGGTVKVGVADFAVAVGEARLTTSGLGSCVGISLFDEEAAVSGLAHVMLPSSNDEPVENEAKYADTAIEALLAEMERHGAKRRRVEAKIAGGSNMLDFTAIGETIGTRNSQAVLETLERMDVPVTGSDVGGDYGRSLEFRSETGTLYVKSANEGRNAI